MRHLPGREETLHQLLTQLLMDNGASVNKTCIDELIKWIAERDQAMINRVIRDAEATLLFLQEQTND